MTQKTTAFYSRKMHQCLLSLQAADAESFDDCGAIGQRKLFQDNRIIRLIFIDQRFNFP
jgi:hypothetical protein